MAHNLMFDSNSILIVLAATVLSFLVDLNKESTATNIKYVFYFSILIHLALFTYFFVAIKLKNSLSSISHITARDMQSIIPSLSPRRSRNTDVTAQEYDLFRLQEQIIFYIGSVITIFIALAFHSAGVSIALYGTALTLGRLFTCELFFIYVLKHKEEGDLKRPWKIPSMNPITAVKELVKEMKKELAQGDKDKKTKSKAK